MCTLTILDGDDGSINPQFPIARGIRTHTSLSHHADPDSDHCVTDSESMPVWEWQPMMQRAAGRERERDEQTDSVQRGA
eukprot:2601496-Rhodomonas_salina.1